MKRVDETDESKELVRRAVAGDANAFRQLLDAHYRTIFRMAYRFCGNTPDAEDVTQMTCMKLAQNIGSFKAESAFTTWLYTVVMNTARDWQRAQSRHDRGAVDISMMEDKIPATDNPEKALAQQEQMDAIRKLPGAEREAVWLVFGEGLSHKEAAAIAGCAEGTISYRIFEARKKLAQAGGGHKYG